MVLPRLGRRDAEALVRALAGVAPLVPDTLDEILERTDGVPLFLEEVTKAVLEAGGPTPRGTAAVPSGHPVAPGSPCAVSLQASLMARLDRLGAGGARGVAQTASAIRPRLSYALVAAAAPGSEAETRAHLDSWSPPAWCSRSALRQPRPTSSSTPWCRTRPIRRCCADRARHCTNAWPLRSKTGCAKPAAASRKSWRTISPRRARPTRGVVLARFRAARGGRSANIEAIAHLQRGIDALVPVAETPGRLELELALQLALGPSLMANEGFWSARGEAAYLRARHWPSASATIAPCSRRPGVAG